MTKLENFMQYDCAVEWKRDSVPQKFHLEAIRHSTETIPVLLWFSAILSVTARD